MKPAPQAVGVLLLGHEGRARGVGIRQADEAELGGRVNNEVLRPPADVLHQEAAPLQRLEHKVAVGHGAHRVPQQALEAQLLGHHLPVHAERVAHQRAVAEGAAVDPLADLAQPLEVVGKGESVAQHPVAPADGLCALQVCVPGHDVVDLGRGALGDDGQEALEEAPEPVELVAQLQAHVGGDLLVAAAARVQLPRDVLADDLAQARSLAVWMSSSAPGMTLKVPASHSFSTSSRPASIFLNSSSVRRPAFVFARAKAMEPRMSCLWRTLSKERDSLYCSMRGSRPPVG